jgi:hypothetical protein
MPPQKPIFFTQPKKSAFSGSCEGLLGQMRPLGLAKWKWTMSLRAHVAQQSQFGAPMPHTPNPA